MLDELLHKHLDKIDEIKENAHKQIDDIVSMINIKNIMKDPEKELLTITSMVRNLLVSTYIPQAIEEGVKLSIDIDKDEEIKVDDSNNPNLNKEIVYD